LYGIIEAEKKKNKKVTRDSYCDCISEKKLDHAWRTMDLELITIYMRRINTH
jgi:hypothetical protein